LPYLAEIIDIMSEDDTLCKERLSKVALITELKGYILPDYVSIVNEEEHPIA
jgi:hypothetical protein